MRACVRACVREGAHVLDGLAHAGVVHLVEHLHESPSERVSERVSDSHSLVSERVSEGVRECALTFTATAGTSTLLRSAIICMENPQAGLLASPLMIARERVSE